MPSDLESIEAATVRRRELMAWDMFYGLGIPLCLIYIIFMYYSPVALIPPAGHDDGHFMQQALNIAGRRWLGAYDHMTLIKGPGLPLFMVLFKALWLPYSVGIATVEAGSFFLLSLVVGRLAKAPGLALLMLGTLLSFPWMWSGDGLRILRDGFYTSLIFVFLALAFLTVWGRDKYRRYCGLAAGIALGFVSITREENPWLWPAVAVLIVALFVAERRRGSSLTALSMIVLWAAIGVAGVRGVILTANYAIYKTFEVADTNERNFRNALRALYSVEPPQRVPYLLVSQQARAAIYEHSPAFARLRALLDGDKAPLSGWQGPGCQWYGGKTCNDYWGGWFVWAFRDAVSLVGGYANAQTAAEFYQQISEDIGRACRNKELACRHSPIAEIPPLVRDNFILMLGSAMNTVKLITLTTPMTADRPRSEGSADSLRLFATFLKLRFIAPARGDPADAIVSGPSPKWMIVFVQSAQNHIRNFYNAVWPIVCAVGGLAILISTCVRLTTTGIDRLMVMTWTLLILVGARIGLLTIVDATVHPAATMDYGNPAAYCLAAGVAMGLYSAAQDVLSLRRRRQDRLEPLPSR